MRRYKVALAGCEPLSALGGELQHIDVITLLQSTISTPERISSMYLDCDNTIPFGTCLTSITQEIVEFTEVL